MRAFNLTRKNPPSNRPRKVAARLRDELADLKKELRLMKEAGHA